MHPTLYAKIVATALALVAAGAAAAGAIGSPPPAADKGLTNAEGHTGFEVPVGPAVQAPEDEAPEDEVVEEETDETVVVEEVEEIVEVDEPKDNHGAAVSEVAKDHTLTGRDHGKAVSEVARSPEGKPEQAGGPKTEDGEGEEEPEPDVTGHG